ncbi:MAG: NAD-dependent DNA ligase LigA, partial [Opitutaceae bacterium]
MTPDSASLRIATLTAEIRRHDELYRNRARPEIGDFEYDALKRELEELERQFPALMVADSPTQRVGDDRSEGFVRTKHRLAMTTLDNTYDEGELRDFDTRLSKLFGREDLLYSVEPKIDGASISVTYENGKLVRAITRGDGEEGDDVTANVKTIAHLPHTLRIPADLTTTPVPALVEIRGEIFLRFSEFSRINQTQEEAGLEPYANPRNLAAGTLKLLDAGEVRARGLEIVLYGFGALEPQGLLASQSEGHAALAQWGLPTLEHRRTVRGIEAVVAAIRELDAHRSTLPYATDGAVVKLDDFALQQQAGFRGEGQSARKLSPRWACAYKFAPERAETRLKAITIQVGRTGVLTPVAELEPVQLAGTTVGRATLHNRDEIARKDIRVGDTVYVEKAGEIIPVVIAVNLSRRGPECAAYVFPETCPVCTSATVQVAGEVAIRCPNPECAAQLVGRLDYVAGRGVLDLEGLGGVVAEKLVTTGGVRDMFDLFALEAGSLGAMNLGTVEAPRILGVKNAKKIVDAITRARGFDLGRWLLALQIR